VLCIFGDLLQPGGIEGSFGASKGSFSTQWPPTAIPLPSLDSTLSGPDSFTPTWAPGFHLFSVLEQLFLSEGWRLPGKVRNKISTRAGVTEALPNLQVMENLHQGLPGW
jgi:hypothetical protein